MNKQEFIKSLQEALMSKVKPELVKEQVRYYSNYIEEEIGKGRGEREVLDELGDPWIIAKNLESVVGNEQEYTYSEEPSGTTGKVVRESAHDSRNHNQGGSYMWSNNVGMGCGLASIIFLIIIFAILYLFVGIMRFLAPLLLPIIIIMIVIRMFQNR